MGTSNSQNANQCKIKYYFGQRGKLRSLSRINTDTVGENHQIDPFHFCMEHAGDLLLMDVHWE